MFYARAKEAFVHSGDARGGLASRPASACVAATNNVAGSTSSPLEFA